MSLTCCLTSVWLVLHPRLGSCHPGGGHIDPCSRSPMRMPPSSARRTTVSGPGQLLASARNPQRLMQAMVETDTALSSILTSENLGWPRKPCSSDTPSIPLRSLPCTPPTTHSLAALASPHPKCLISTPFRNRAAKHHCPLAAPALPPSNLATV